MTEKGRSLSCPTCDTALVYRRWYLNRDGYWCPSCYEWCKPVVVRAPARTSS